MSPLALDLGSSDLVASTFRGAAILLAAGAVATLGLPVLARLQPAGGPASTPKAPRTGDSRALLIRYGSAFGTVAVFFGASYFGGWVFAAVIALLVAIGLLEFWQMAEASGVVPFSATATPAALALLAAAAWFGPAALGPAIVGALALILLNTLRAPLEGLPARLGLTMLGVLYVGLQATFMLLLRQGPNGYAHFCLYFAVIQAADAFAFFGGRAFGRHPIAPTLSPGKTWEGCAVGLLAALATARLFAFAAPGMAGWAVYAIGAGIFAFSLLGDLVASGFKRAAGLKDFGRLLPEQGGLLDRFDGYLLAAPATYYLFQLLGQ